MVNFNKTLLGVSSATETTVYTQCPLRKELCIGSQCVCAIVDINTSTNEYKFTGCNLLESFYSIQDHGPKLEAIGLKIDQFHADNSNRLDALKLELLASISLMKTTIVDQLITLQNVLAAKISENTEKLVDIITHLNTVIVDLHEIQAKLESIDGRLYTSNVLNDHLHKQHQHPKSHNASLKDSSLGSKFISMAQPAVYLMQEWTTNTDVDGNGRIYGRDFMISNTDPEKPMMLKGIEESESWRNPTGPGSKITYAEYLQSINWYGE